MSFIIYINVSAFFWCLQLYYLWIHHFVSILSYLLNLTECDKSYIILKEKKYGKRYEYDEKFSKKIGALVAAAVMVCAIFVGCGSSKYDTSTPDGALMT